MKILILALAAALIPFQSQASFFEKCVFLVEVKELPQLAQLGGVVQQTPESGSTYTPVAVVKIVGAKIPSAAPGTREECRRHIGQSKTLTIAKGLPLTVGQGVEVEYTYANGLTPNGVASREAWLVK
ncbi:MAG TPA: hypothetical protein VFV50_09340 [Bdellovibrionales bacterium]|nr:hypothetical protein [Bdellovibrionales bacterium]